MDRLVTPPSPRMMPDTSPTDSPLSRATRRTPWRRMALRICLVSFFCCLPDCPQTIWAWGSGRASFVYDLMEPHRPEVDRYVLDFVRRQAFMPQDFVIDAKGVCRLHPDLARMLCERIDEGRRRASETIMQAAACLLDSDCEAGTGVKRYVVGAE